VAKFTTGVIFFYTGGKFAASVVELIPVAILPPVSLRPVANLPPVLLITVVHLDLRENVQKI
jgi:hypothetical protein